MQPTAHQEQFGVQYLAQGLFDMPLEELRIRTSNLLITRRPSLPLSYNEQWHLLTSVQVSLFISDWHSCHFHTQCPSCVRGKCWSESGVRLGRLMMHWCPEDSKWLQCRQTVSWSKVKGAVFFLLSKKHIIQTVRCTYTWADHNSIHWFYDQRGCFQLFQTFPCAQ